MWNLKKTALFVAFIYIFITGMAYLLQEKLLFLPTELPQDFEYSFAQPFKEVFLTSEDGAKLNALHFKVDNPKGVILYFHGNAGDLSRWGEIAGDFTQFQYDVFVLDYRTYGKSTGALSEQAFYDDAQLCYQYLQKQYSDDRITLYGRSLGTGVATYLASINKPKQLLLETPYYSILDIAKRRFPILPVRYLLKYKFESYLYLKEVKCPVTIFHGTSDGVVSYDSGVSLSEVLPKNQCQLITIEGGGHNNLIEFEEYRQAVSEVLE